MSLLNQPAIRAWIRRLGVARVGARWLRRLSGTTMRYDSQYELRFAKELLGAVSAGDCVWDVGANVGHFTRQLAERVGPSGSVIAFEPFYATFEMLKEETRALSQVRCIQVALGAEEAELRVAGDPGNPANSLATKCENGAGESIRVTTGDKLLREGCPQPHVIKVDVEGFEEDVLWGFREGLRKCSAVLVEVHYKLLSERGYERAPLRIVSFLEDLGFETRWLGPNHLKAVRPR